jgi:uncharacterized membrane protein
MSDKTFILSIFDNEELADRTAKLLKDYGLVDNDAVGVLALDDKGALKIDKIGARNTGKGVGIGAVLWILGPVGMTAGLAGGALIGALHRKGLGLDEPARDRIAKELEGGHAAVGVLTSPEKVGPVVAQLNVAGGTTETHATSDEALDEAALEGNIGHEIRRPPV